MAKQSDLDGVYMGTAVLHSGLSKALRGGVGAVLVTPQGVTLTGFNGTAPGRPNECEEVIGYEKVEEWDDSGGRATGWLKGPAILQTKPEVIHAELNCILKAAKEGVSVEGSTVYVTLSPCVPCAAMLVACGISRLVYKREYRDISGLELLKETKIIVEKSKEV